MKSWSLSDAGSNISEVCEAALRSGPQRIEGDERSTVLVVSEADWNRLTSAYATFAELVLEAPFEPGDLPERRPARVVRVDPL